MDAKKCAECGMNLPDREGFYFKKGFANYCRVCAKRNMMPDETLWFQIRDYKDGQNPIYVDCLRCNQTHEENVIPDNIGFCINCDKEDVPYVFTDEDGAEQKIVLRNISRYELRNNNSAWVYFIDGTHLRVKGDVYHAFNHYLMKKYGEVS